MTPSCDGEGLHGPVPALEPHNSSGGCGNRPMVTAAYTLPSKIGQYAIPINERLNAVLHCDICGERFGLTRAPNLN